MTIGSPPLQQPIIDAQPGQQPMGGMNLLWMLFFNQIYQGDSGTLWIPTVKSLTVSGTAPTTTGRVYKLSQYLTFFRLNIIAPSGSTSTSTAGTTYIDNFPYVMSGDGFCVSVSNKLGGSVGMCEQATNKIWLPAWTTISNPITVIGAVEAS